MHNSNHDHLSSVVGSSTWVNSSAKTWQYSMRMLLPAVLHRNVDEGVRVKEIDDNDFKKLNICRSGKGEVGELEKVKNNSSQLQDTPVVPVVVVAVTFFVTNGAATSTHNVA